MVNITGTSDVVRVHLRGTKVRVQDRQRDRNCRAGRNTELGACYASSLWATNAMKKSCNENHDVDTVSDRFVEPQKDGRLVPCEGK